jgi:RES domain-containing protein
VGTITTHRLAFTDSLMTAFKPRGAEARWNSSGVVMVYTSEHQALAALEILNYWERYDRLEGYHAYTSTFDEAVVETPDLNGVNILDRPQAQAIGDAWIARRSSVALRVPSVAIPKGINYLLNPNHPDFYEAVRLEAHGPFQFDARVVGLMAAARQPRQS